MHMRLRLSISPLWCLNWWSDLIVNDCQQQVTRGSLRLYFSSWEAEIGRGSVIKLVCLLYKTCFFWHHHLAFVWSVFLPVTQIGAMHKKMKTELCFSLQINQRLGWGCGLQMNTDNILAFSKYVNYLFREILSPNEWYLNCLRKCILLCYLGSQLSLLIGCFSSYL
jgi:hypothetical protein